MKRNKWRDRLACAFLVTGTIVGVALAAGTQGSQTDPLVTLSYLNEVAMPELMGQVDQRLAQRENELMQKLQSAGGSNQGSFAAVEVPAGGVVTLEGGAQVMLRKGSAATTFPLVDVTTGETAQGGLIANHLYLATASGQQVTAKEAATLLILGGHS